MEDKIWFDSYVPGTSREIDPDAYPSLMEILEQSFEKYSDKTAFINFGNSKSFAEIDRLSKQFAAYLQSDLGLKQGDAVAIMMPNLLQYPIALAGIIRAGLVVVNVNPLYTARELKHQLNDSGAKAILIIENFAHTLEKVIAETKVEKVITTQMGDMLNVPKRWLVNFVVKRVKKLVPAFSLPGAINFNSALAKGASLPYTRPEIKGEDLALLQYTGGTTGLSKGAMLTHRNMVANLEQAHSALSAMLEEGKELVVTALPLYHIFAFTANMLVFMKLGGSNLLITNPRDLPAFVAELKKYPFTAFTAVNTLFNGLLNTPGFSDVNFGSLKLSLGGGMAVQRPVAEHWQQVTRTRLLEGYGLTECAPLVTITPTNAESYTGSIGVPAPSTDVRVVDADGQPLPIGEAGELQVKGPQVMKGYLNNEEATREVISEDGWFSTGDVAKMDEKGFFFIVDRKKDMILVSGFNVFPNEIEEVIVSHDKVLEAAAVGVPHDVSGEAVKLFVVRKDNSLNEEEVISYCRENLTAYKVPKLIEFRDELPKTNVGKILRRELRDK